MAAPTWRWGRIRVSSVRSRTFGRAQAVRSNPCAGAAFGRAAGARRGVHGIPAATCARPAPSLSPPMRCVSHTPRAEARCPEDDFMSMPTNGGPAGAAPQPGQAEKPPQLNVLAQYTKDFSFENPNAPRSLMPSQQQPSISIQINVAAKPVAENDVEVELKLEGKAESAGNTLFQFELIYAGVF